MNLFFTFSWKQIAWGKSLSSQIQEDEMVTIFAQILDWQIKEASKNQGGGVNINDKSITGLNLTCYVVKTPCLMDLTVRRAYPVDEKKTSEAS